MKKYCLFTICDDNYSEPCKVMINSFLINNKWFNGDIIVLYDFMKDENIQYVKNLDDKIIFLKVNEDNRYDVFFKCEQLTKNKNFLRTFYKFEMFNPAFAEKYEYAMWLDSDIVVNGDVYDFFVNDYDFAWCDDRISTDGAYCNSGVFRFSYNSLNGDSFYNLIFDFVNNLKFENTLSGKGFYPDQDILNELVNSFFKNVKIFNWHLYNKTDFYNPNINGVKIIHYCGGEKPFNVPIKNMYFVYFVWYYYYYYVTNKKGNYIPVDTK